MAGFWGVWRRDQPSTAERDLVRMGQGLVLSGAPLTRSAGGFGAAAVAQHSSGQDAIRQTADGAWLVGTARLDNRAELCTLLDGAVHPGAAFSDLDLVERAYLRWGERCVEYLRGDWALAIWQPAASFWRATSLASPAFITR